MSAPRRAATRPRRPWWVAALVLVIATAMTVGAVWVYRAELRRLLGDDPRVGTGALVPQVAPAPSPVLSPLPRPSAGVNAAALAARLDAVKRDQLTNVGIAVLDATSGDVLYRAGGTPQAPASTMKILSGLVALDVLGPDTTFATRVVPGASGQIVLVGGGDPLLRSASSDAYPRGPSLQDLATKTAAALKATGATSVTLGYDASRFTGPAWHPAWPDTFRWHVAPITALTADHARPDLAKLDRAPDPARYAADQFALWLGRAGVSVTAVAPAKAPAGALSLAVVESLPVSVLVEQSLTRSDNDTAETLAWQVAIARGKPGSAADAADVLAAELQARGLWEAGMNVTDGNGIATTNQVTPSVLARAVRLGLEQPKLRALATGLPVAGVTGTLDDRFASPAALPGRGVVRAKTGTIRGVHALAGYVVTRDGHPLAFAFILNEAAGSVGPRAWIDEASAALASCGC